MSINLSNRFSVHNKYALELKNAITGEVKQCAEAYNTVTNALWEVLSYTYSSKFMYYGIKMGNGTGEPSATRLDLFSTVFSYTMPNDSTYIFEPVESREAFPTCAYTFKVEIPASTSYVGDLTEVGIRSNNISGVWSHAMLQDAEGNPITIHKTDLDVLTVTVTVYLTFSASDSNFTWATPGPKNPLCMQFRERGRTGAFFSDNKIMACTASISVDSIDSIATPVQLGRATWDVASRTVSVPTIRMDRTVGNGVYYNAFVIGYSADRFIGGIVLPNADIFPDQKLSGMSVGTGDGNKKQFNLPIPYVLKDSETIYVDGVAKRRGTDYTCDNASTYDMPSVEASNFLLDITGTLDIPADIPDMPAEFVNPTFAPEYPIFTNHVIGTRESLLRSDKPHVYAVSKGGSDELAKINHIRIDGAAPFRYNADKKDMPNYWSCAIYGKTDFTSLPEVGTHSSAQGAATALLGMYYADPTSVPMLVDAGGVPCFLEHANKLHYRAVKLTNCSCLYGMYINSSDSNKYVIAVTLPGSVGGYGARHSVSSYNEEAKTDFNYSGVTSTTRDLSFLNGREDLLDSAITTTSMYMNYRSDTQVTVYYGYASNTIRTYMIPVPARKYYAIKVNAPGGVVFAIDTTTDFRTYTSGNNSTYNAIAANRTPQTDDVYICGGNSSSQYLYIQTYTTEGDEADISVYDVSDVDAYLLGRANLDRTPASSYRVYYHAMKFPFFAATPRWSAEIITSDEYRSNNLKEFSYNGCKIIIEGANSANGPWDYVTDVSYTAPNAYMDNNGYSNLSNARACFSVTKDFPAVTYPFYRVRLDISEATDPHFAKALHAAFVSHAHPTQWAYTIPDGGSKIEPLSAQHDLSYIGSGITFTNPPAAGAVITMDADIDRPYKNDNFVIDMAMSVHFSEL